MNLTIAINELFGREPADVSPCVGRVIDSVSFDDGAEDGQLLFSFVGGGGLSLRDEGRSCCESRYMTTDDDLTHFVGAEFRGAEVRDGPDVEDEYGAHEQSFLIVTTSEGSFTVVTHNEHNGYYGGFWLVAEVLKAKDSEEQDG